jgi:hypothetical protein
VSTQHNLTRPAAEFIDLTAEQIAQLKPFYDYIAAEHEAGRTGMLIAQVGRVWNWKMKVAFIPHDMAKKLVATMQESADEHGGESREG